MASYRDGATCKHKGGTIFLWEGESCLKCSSIHDILWQLQMRSHPNAEKGCQVLNHSDQQRKKIKELKEEFHELSKEKFFKTCYSAPRSIRVAKNYGNIAELRFLHIALWSRKKCSESPVNKSLLQLLNNKNHFQNVYKCDKYVF